MTPEGRVKEAVKDLLKEHGAYKHMPVQNGMGEPALDFHVCHQGFYATIETKALGEHPTRRQINTIREAMAAKASVFVIDSKDGLDFAALQGWLKHPHPGCVGPVVLIELENWRQKRESRNAGSGDTEHTERRQGT
jgi:hypothetical protein